MPTIWGYGIHAGVPWDVGIEEMECLLEMVGSSAKVLFLKLNYSKRRSECLMANLS